MMNRKEFYEFMKDTVREYLPDDFADASITLDEMTKNNDTKSVILVIRKEDDVITPLIHLDRMYDSYRDGTSPDILAMKAANLRLKEEIRNFDMPLTQIKDYDQIKSRLSIRICDPELNRERLEDKAFARFGDFAATYCVRVGEDKTGTSIIQVTDNMVKEWGVSMEQLHADALAADRQRGPAVYRMDEIMDSMMGMLFDPVNLLEGAGDAEPSIYGLDMFCMTNEGKVNGASLILHDDILAQVGDILGKDFYVLPSSTHETMILPDNGAMDVAQMNDMVREINEEVVDPAERLSDKVQYYDRESHVLENAENREARMSMMEKTEAREEGPRSIKERLSEAKEESKAMAAMAEPKERFKKKETAIE